MRPVKIHAEQPLTGDDLVEAIADVCKRGELAVILFTGSWCTPCTKLKEHIFTDRNPGMSKEYDKYAVFFYIDHDENKELATEYNVNSLPTILLGRIEKGSFKLLEKVVGGSPLVLQNKIIKYIS